MASTTQIIFFAVFSLCSLVASTQADHGEQSNVTALEAESNVREGKGVERSCHCQGKQCTCCAKIDIKKVKLREDACISLAWMPEQLEAAAEITVGDKVVYDETFSAHNPPNLCFGVPGLPRHAKLCINFYDVTIDDHKLYACAKLEAKLFRRKVGEFKFDCFNTKI